MEFLRAFKAQHSDLYGQLTTEQVCHILIKPQTALHRRSVVHQLWSMENFSESGEESNWFVCHAWSSLLFPMIDAILRFFDDRADADAAIIWIDLFCISQHLDPESALSPLWWSGFSYCVDFVGRMLFVIDSWNEPKPLQRSW